MPIEIDPTDQLYRRIDQTDMSPDGTVNSTAFMTNRRVDPHLPVDLGRLVTPEASVRGANVPHLELGVVMVQAEVPMGMGLGCTTTRNRTTMPTA